MKGVGPRLAEKLSRIGIFTVSDLLHLIPLRYVDRRTILSIQELSPGKEKTILGDIIRSGISFLGRRRKRIFEVLIQDESGGVASLKWFHFRQKIWEQRFAIGTKLLVSGEATRFGNTSQFLHPEVEIFAQEDEAQIVGKILPIYPLTEGLYQKTMRNIIRNAWDTYGKHIEPLFPEKLAEEYRLADPRRCLQEIHFPEPDADLEHLLSGRSSAHRTLIFDEFFFLELGMAMRKKSAVAQVGMSFPHQKALQEIFFNSLSFQFTSAQQRALSEVQRDMERAIPMNRLLQGDVGCGKTIVALAAALQVIAAGAQVAFMVPTEILAEQHYQTLSRLLAPLSLPLSLLTSSVTGKERETIRTRLARGELPLVVGTHALIQEDVNFAKLGLAIVDEQHRFGVLQRKAIRAKGEGCDILVMTATPIPRTLAMTLYGDLDISVIDALPHGRKPIITKLYHEGQRQKLYQGMRHELQRGRQIYVVYPLIEESEKLDLKNATHMTEEIRAVFSPEYDVELLHGRMKGEIKEKIMSDYAAGKTHILVATSVVEVGIDVPNATVIVIEHAERFGLSQLHQLRGRVGRGEHQSYCVLMADYKRSKEARRRLRVMCETNDGFKIAEEDLAIRGPGEFIGTRQSGLPPLRVANLARDVGILSQAREAAFRVTEADPGLIKPEHCKLREVFQARWAGKLELAQVS